MRFTKNIKRLRWLPIFIWTSGLWTTLGCSRVSVQQDGTAQTTKAKWIDYVLCCSGVSVQQDVLAQSKKVKWIDPVLCSRMVSAQHVQQEAFVIQEDEKIKRVRHSFSRAITDIRLRLSKDDLLVPALFKHIKLYRKSLDTFYKASGPRLYAELLSKLINDHIKSLLALDSDGLIPVYLAIQNLNLQKPCEMELFRVLCSCYKAYDGNFLSDYQDANGSTFLHLAISIGSPLEMVKELVMQGANVNAQDHDHDTPLHFAAVFKSPRAVVRELLTQGARLDIQNHNQETPLEVARRFEHHAMVEELYPFSYLRAQYSSRHKTALL